MERDPENRYDSTRDLAIDLARVETRSSELRSAESLGAGNDQPRRKGSKALFIALLAAASAAVAAVIAITADRSTIDSTQLAYQQITFRRGMVTSARFEPDGEAVLYSAAWEGGTNRIHLHRPQAQGSMVVGPPDSRLVSVSPNGELLLLSELAPAGPFLTAGELNRMPVTGGPRALYSNVTDAAFGPDGEVAAVVREVNGRAILEFPAGTERLSTNGMLLLLRLSPDGQRVAFGHSPQRGHDWGRIVVLDRDGGSIQLDQEAGRGLSWSPAGDELWYVSKRQYNRLEAVTLDGDIRQVATFPSEVFLFDIARDGRVLLATEQRRYEAVGRKKGENERDLSWLEWSVPFDVSADGETILFNECVGQGASCRIALRGFGSEPTIVLDNDGFGVAISPDEKWVISAPPWNPQELDIIATETQEQRRFELPSLERIGLATWAPDGSAVFLSANAPGQGDRIYRLDLDTGIPVPITAEGIGFGFFAVSPDGEFVAAPLVDGGIAIFSLDGGEPKLIDSDEQPVRWSEDGRSIYTIPLGVAPTTLHRVDVGSGTSTLVATLMPADPAGVAQVAPVTVTPDGSTYVYGYVRRLSELFIVDGLVDSD
jgi:Tol biopolymer transport system component